MTTVNSWSELEKILHKQIIEILNKIGTEIKGVLRDELNKSWYQSHEPSSYERSFQLLESISLSPLTVTGNEYSVQIYYDTSKIIPMDGTMNKPWTRHKSIVDDRSSAEALPYYIESGNGNSPIYQFEGVSPVENVLEWQEEDKYVLHRFKELLEDKGYKCVIG